MAKMRARRAPFTDPRDGRLKFAITCTGSWGRFAAVHESAFGTKRTSRSFEPCPLLGVKRTWLERAAR